jgi:hypothetical protein
VAAFPRLQLFHSSWQISSSVSGQPNKIRLIFIQRHRHDIAVQSRHAFIQGSSGRLPIVPEFRVRQDKREALI